MIERDCPYRMVFMCDVGKGPCFQEAGKLHAPALECKPHVSDAQLLASELMVYDYQFAEQQIGATRKLHSLP